MHLWYLIARQLPFIAHGEGDIEAVARGLCDEIVVTERGERYGQAGTRWTFRHERD